MDRRDFLKKSARAAAFASAARAFPAGAAGKDPSMTMTARDDCLLLRRVSGLKDPAFGRLLEVLRSGDCRWGNGETVLADAATCYPAPKAEDPLVISEPWAADELKWTGFNLMDRRGTPVLASREDAESILHELAELSRPYGTRIRERNGVGEIELG
jgi:hypothetical protein